VRTGPACLPCFTRQVSRTLAYAGVNGDEGQQISREAERIIEGASFDQAPARISTLLHRLIRTATGVDPYRNVKETYNRIALDQLPGLRSLAAADADAAVRLASAVRAAIAGNIIDFGIYDRVDLSRSVSETFGLPLPQPAFRKFSEAVGAARNVLYLCDNAGEIVFDRILIELLRQQGKQVTAVVKGVPVINDATMEDARAAGLAESADRVIDNGNDGIGTLLELCSDEFREAYRGADLIISKGQANYETLAPERDGRTFYLFKVKCSVVAEALGKQEGDIVLQGPGGQERR
jgi:damage-control phosphatase, subfamily I